MKAISIRQPWAELIARGEKTIETRTWSTGFRGELLICAGSAPADFLKKRPGIIHPEKGIWCDARDAEDEEFEYFFHFGKALAVVELYDIVKMTHEHETDALCDVYPGAFAWKLRNIRRIKPFSIKGQLGIFEIETENII